MDTIQIPCPKCGAELKLRDRNLLGRKGKCPKCSHAFVLEEPSEVVLELAQPEASLKRSGQSRSEKTSGEARVVEQQKPNASSLPESPFAEFNPTKAAITSTLDAFGAENETAASRLRALKRKNARQRNVILSVGGILLAAIGVGLGIALSNSPSADTGTQTKVAAANVSSKTENNRPGMDIADQLPDEFATSGSPTKGKPITFQYMPFGTQIAIHVRPAELWNLEHRGENRGEELRFCLTDPTNLLATTLQSLFKRKPEQIEEALICLIPGVQGSMPELAGVGRMVDDQKKSQLLDDYGGERIDDHGFPVYVTDNRGYMVIDPKTIVVGPKEQAAEMVQAIQRANPANDGIDELLPMTDRDRHLTFVFVPRALRLHSNFWFVDKEGKPNAVAQLTTRFCDFLGDEIESAAWSFHFGERVFFSEMLLRNVAGVSSSRMAKDFQKKLDQFAPDMLATVRMMHPREAGKRSVISRLPVMTDAFTMATHVTTGARHIQLTTPLPERAAPNLALAGLLAWDESTRTDFTKKAVTKPTPSNEPKIPDLVADRLKLKIDIDFRRTPLQDAMAYIGGEIKTTIDIDGDALKFGGFTKNMPQEMKIDGTTAKGAIAKILEKYQDTQRPDKHMVIVIDESKKTILLTTQGSCEKNNLTPFDVMK